ncbi:hypothetical protein E2C01_080276 [Portunus trituberculatus]|uniref:Uncharacterized protein n=1 Tax=Portunus trituberculatus TaxID=210409 RepID=A0A5B7IVL7_PORTR|nr:hypothetical protein [Portunus trituberculatus]
MLLFLQCFNISSFLLTIYDLASLRRLVLPPFAYSKRAGKHCVPKTLFSPLFGAGEAGVFNQSSLLPTLRLPDSRFAPSPHPVSSLSPTRPLLPHHHAMPPFLFSLEIFVYSHKEMLST